MGIDELREWQAFDSVNPIGDYRMDLNFALLAQKTIAWSDHCKEAPSIKDLLVIDPFPLTNEQRAIETAKADAERSQADAERSQAYTESLIATLKQRAKK